MTTPGPRPLPQPCTEPCTCLWVRLREHLIDGEIVTAYTIGLVDPDCPSHLPDPD